MIENYGMCLNELLRASCPPPFGPAELFKFVPDQFVRKNLAALGNCSLRCSITYVHVGDLDRSPLIHSYCYASAGDQSTFADRDVAVRRPGARAMQEQLAAFAIFPLILFTWM